MKYLPEIEAKYLLPLIRKELVKELKFRGYNQEEISEKVGITQAAVSYYLNDKRVKGELPEDLKREIKRIADEINGLDEEKLSNRIAEICKIALKNGILCEIHKKHENVPDNCKICLKWG